MKSVTRVMVLYRKSNGNGDDMSTAPKNKLHNFKSYFFENLF